MIHAIIVGIGVGIIIAIPTGPIGFLVMRRMLLYGVRAGMYSAVGSIVSDMFYAIVVGFSITHILRFFLAIQNPLQIIAGVLIAWMGWQGLRKVHNNIAENDPEFNPLRDFVSTFVVNFMSPQVIVSFTFLFAIVGVGKTILDPYHIGVFIAAVLSGSFLWWYGLALWIDRMRLKGRDVSAESVRLVSAWVLIGSGIFLIGMAIVRIVV